MRRGLFAGEQSALLDHVWQGEKARSDDRHSQDSLIHPPLCPVGHPRTRWCATSLTALLRSSVVRHRSRSREEQATSCLPTTMLSTVSSTLSSVPTRRRSTVTACS